MRSGGTDMLCPWYGGDLPEKPDQCVKCHHFSSDIHWGYDGKHYKPKLKAYTQQVDFIVLE